MLGERGLCERCAADHWMSCPRDHVPNVKGAHGYCLGLRCLASRAEMEPLPVRCIPKREQQEP